MDLLNYFWSYFIKPYRWSVQITKWSARATPDWTNFTAMNTWSTANHEQKWPYRSCFHPSPGGADRHLYTLSVTAPGGRFYTDPTWIRQSGQSSRFQTVTESLWPERTETPNTQHDMQTFRARIEILEADKLAWAAGKGGGRWWAQAGRLTAHVKFIVSHGLRGNTSPLRDVSEKQAPCY